MAKRTLAKIATAELADELHRRKIQTHSLQKKRDALAKQLEQLDDRIQELGGLNIDSVPRGAGGRRRRNAANLVQSLEKLLQNKSMNVTEITSAVQKAGYTTTSPNFRTIVNQTLINSPKFKRVDRGVYTVKESAKS